MNLNSFIKKCLALDVLFGSKKKKISGINDSNNFVNETLVIDNVTKTITLTGTIPSFLTVGKLFRITNGGGTNFNQLFRIQSISGNIITCDITGSYFDPQNYTGMATIDGRMWIVINNPTIANTDVNGGTIFNLDNVMTTGLPDGSGVALNTIGHYHTDSAKSILDNIVTHERNSLGNKMYLYDNDFAIHVESGPLIVVDSNGNVVYT